MNDKTDKNTPKKDNKVNTKNNDDKQANDNDFDLEKELEDLLGDSSFDDKMEEMGIEKPSKEDILQEDLAEKDSEIAELKAKIAEQDKKIAKLEARNKQLEELVRSANRQRERLQEQFNVQAERQIQKFIKDRYLPTVDSLEHALKYISGEQDIEGIKGILTNCYNDLAAVNIEKIEAEGAEFNPEYHNALAVANDQDKPDNSVIMVQKSGYRNTKTGELVRPAEVIVNKLN